MNGGEKFYPCSWWSCSHPKRTIFCLTILATDWDLSKILTQVVEFHPMILSNPLLCEILGP